MSELVPIQKRFYRFRSVQALLDWKELEEEYIYFTPKYDLNDPKEGYLNLTFQGDSILWINFLQIYIFSVYSFWSRLILSGDSLKKEMTENDIYVDFDSDLKDSLSSLENGVYSKTCNYFFNDSVIQDLIVLLDTNQSELTKSELSVLLCYMHILILVSIRKSEFDLKISSANILRDLLLDYVCGEELARKTINKICTLIKTKGDIQDFFKNKLKQIDIKIHDIRLHGICDMIIAPLTDSLEMLIRFPIIYTNKLTQLVFPEHYVASFCTNWTNPLMWTHYGDSGKGACLVYKFNYDNKANKYFSYIKNMNDKQWLHRVRYITDLKQREHFEFFSNLVVHHDYGLNPWFFLRGEKSRLCHKHWYFQDENKNAEGYIAKVIDVATTKSKLYKYESEYRTVAVSFDYEEEKFKSPIRWEYSFCDLFGIIFGVRMDEQKKKEIIKIIKDKCKKYGRDKFNFYQAIDNNEGKIKKYRLPY